MKAKCINANSMPYGESLTKDKIYDVISIQGENVLIKNDENVPLYYSSYRFLIFADDLQFLKADLERAENCVTEIKEKIKKLMAESLEVGQVWEHINHQEKYLLTQIGLEYALVCIEGYFKGNLYTNPTAEKENVFCGMKELFELQKKN